MLERWPAPESKRPRAPTTQTPPAPHRRMGCQRTSSSASPAHRYSCRTPMATLPAGKEVPGTQAWTMSGVDRSPCGLQASGGCAWQTSCERGGRPGHCGRTRACLTWCSWSSAALRCSRSLARSGACSSRPYLSRCGARPGPARRMCLTAMHVRSGGDHQVTRHLPCTPASARPRGASRIPPLQSRWPAAPDVVLTT